MAKAGVFAGRPDGFRLLFTELKHFRELIICPATHSLVFLVFLDFGFGSGPCEC